MQKSGKLELTWVGKYEQQQAIEPRILLEDKSKSYGDAKSGNMLIHGDNLIALKALEQDFAGKVKCIYIDPPYNTGSAFEHYDDGLEHSKWLCMMRPRLEILRNLLSDDGSIWISIDDEEQAYLKVLCDEIFGRHNYKTTICWQRKYSVSNNYKGIAKISEFVLVYSKTANFIPNLLPRTEESAARYSNPDNDSRGEWKAVDYLNQATTKQRPNLCYDIINPLNGNVVKNGVKAWKYDRSTHQVHVDENRLWWGISGENTVPSLKLFLAEVRNGMTPHNWWPHEVAGHTDEAKKESILLFGPADVFSTPKPERLIERIVTLATNSDDLILDSFLGSGATAAVAHKMGRRWIGIELGEHAYTHCKVRLDKVIDGEQGGISKSVNWQGGGGYGFYELAPSLLEKHPILPVYQINKGYTFEMLCEAICKLEGFSYKPTGEMHGCSSETRFIHVAKDFISGDYITKIMKSIGENQSVLIYGIKTQSGLRLPSNVEVKRIPKDLLSKCSFESEVR